MVSLMFADEGVYVNTNGELVRHAMLQWGETPYAIGKLSYKFIIRGNIFQSWGNITIEFMVAGINMFWARLRLILARTARRGLK